MRSIWYILDEDERPVPVDMATFHAWDAAHSRTTEYDEVGGVRVSTVFMGIDHGLWQDEPVLWESMVFGGEFDGWQERYTSAADARRGHAWMLARVMSAQLTG